MSASTKDNHCRSPSKRPPILLQRQQYARKRRRTSILYRHTTYTTSTKEANSKDPSIRSRAVPWPVACRTVIFHFSPSSICPVVPCYPSVAIPSEARRGRRRGLFKSQRRYSRLCIYSNPFNHVLFTYIVSLISATGLARLQFGGTSSLPLICFWT